MSLTKTLFTNDELNASIQNLATADVDGRGAIFTRQEVVDFILDLVGYTNDKPLFEYRILEPSFGEGDFLLPLVSRLLDSAVSHKKELTTEHLGDAVRGVELHEMSFEFTKKKLLALLFDRGSKPEEANAIVDKWLIQGDFLLQDYDLDSFTHVVGNPPYIRQEEIPDVLMREYRARYSTIYDRADIYVPFYERSLSLLDNDGRLGFICANRWMKNRYGTRLREHITNNFNLDYYVDMVGTPAFTSDVIAYPAITVISNTTQRHHTRVFSRPEINAKQLKQLAQKLQGGGRSIASYQLERSGAPWFLESSAELELIKKLEETFPALEDAGCRVGIGVASGADKVFVTDYATLDVEDDRKLPLVKTIDIRSGEIVWQGKGIVNPFREDGTLVDLEDYPRLADYFTQHEKVLKARHVAKKAPINWYRTIDRIHHHLTATPKLLIPDIKGTAHIVYDSGEYYPHHNLYYVVSDAWDLRSLKAILETGIAHLFIDAYATKMHGDCLRFQAQYLRRIRVPEFDSVSPQTIGDLKTAIKLNDRGGLLSLVSGLYGLNSKEISILEKYAVKS